VGDPKRDATVCSAVSGTGNGKEAIIGFRSALKNGFVFLIIDNLAAYG